LELPVNDEPETGVVAFCNRVLCNSLLGVLAVSGVSKINRCPTSSTEGKAASMVRRRGSR